MEPFRYHVFVCDQAKPEGVPGCAASGSAKVIEELRREIAKQGLMDAVQLTTCGSLGLCEHGPNMVVYPEGIWYSGVTPQDVPEIVGSHFRDGVAVERLARLDTSEVRAEILSNREKFLAAQRARRYSGTPPDELMQTIRGFQESRVVLSALELDVFTAVGSGSSVQKVVATCATDPRATEMLLNALVSMGLLAKSDGHYRNTAASARYFVAGSPDNARPGLLHTAHMWQRWTNLTECVRTGTAVGHEEIVDRGEEWTTAFIAAMHRGATERAPLVVRAVGARTIRRMLDVGGGSGAYSIAFAHAHPDLRADVFDLPQVVPIARAHIESAGLGSRITTHTGDLRLDSFSAGYDLVLLSSICHMLNPSENRDLLRRCYAALEPGGLIVIQEFILEPDKTAPKSATLFSLNMLVGTLGGSSYSVDEYTEWLLTAGFEDVRRVRIPGPSNLMLAGKGS